MTSFQLNITKSWLIKGPTDNREWQVNNCRWSWPISRPNQGSSWRKWGKQRKYQRRHPVPTRPQFTLSTALCKIRSALRNFVESSVAFFTGAILEYCDWLTAWVVTVCQPSEANEPICECSVRSSTGSSPANESESRPCLQTHARAHTHTQTYKETNASPWHAWRTQ